MRTWPTITLRNHPLALPVVGRTLNRYVLGIVQLTGQARSDHLLKLFADDPFFATWAYAVACARGQRPGDLGELVQWMNESGHQAIANLDPDSTGELQPPAVEDAIRIVATVVANSRHSEQDLVAELGMTDPEQLELTEDTEIKGALTQLASVPHEQDMMHLSFQDLQKVLRWESMEQEFQQQLHVQKMLAIKNLAYGASHEINNPLANISTRAQALLRDETDSERQRSLGTISDQAFRANAMIADLMLFAHPPTMDLKPQQLAALFQRCLVEMQANLDLAEIQVQCNGSDDVLVMGDRKALFEMFKAILQNCIDAIQGGMITISWESSLGQVQIRVDDDGPGVTDEIMPFIFDPFFSGREAGRGLGFGLSKAWRIMQIHHGSIEIENREPRGLRVTICIPQAASDAAATG